MPKKHKQRTYLDPIHGTIPLYLDDPIDNLLSKLIDTSDFQRLRRIKQLGTGWLVFHGAEHTRFGHCIGTMHNAIKIISHLARNFLPINRYEVQILTCALLHDIGHGPFSHTAEKLSGISHEEITKRIILENTEINKILVEFDKKLPQQIIKTFEYKNLPQYVSQLISSYIDCDRLDYLHRDSYYVGVPYGLTGADRIISSLEIEKDKLVINEKIGLDAVIHYLHARYSMYQQVYQHKKNLASDFLLLKIIEKIKHLKPKGTSHHIFNWLNIENKPKNKIDIDSFLKVDDYLLISIFQKYSEEEKIDSTLKKLCSNFISRKLFKSYEFRIGIKKEKQKEILNTLKIAARKKGFEADYFLGIETSSSKPYEPYALSRKTSKAIFIKQNNGRIEELSKISGLVKALSMEDITKTCLVFTPELEEDLNSIKGFSELFK